jgi:DNA helicase-2/ATP-dependent DNA helicase PcrA
MKLNLSPTQQKIVDHVDGALLVKAGPGSGKTRVLIERMKKLLLTKKRSKILALTFSNLAAEEMKNRLQEDAAIEDYIDNVTVGTIHSFCLEIVQTRGNLIGLRTDLVLFENTTDRQTVLRDVFHRDTELLALLNSREKPDAFLSQCLNLISEQKKKFILPELCELKDPFPRIYSGYNQYLIEQNAIDFDDILFYAYLILIENPSVVHLYTSLYRYICVDEAQDLNFAQYEVIKALCGTDYKNVMFVGDENQSIYGFNGSDSSLMSKGFVKDFSPTEYTLNENFRSAKAIVAYANKLEQSDSVSNYYYDGELKTYSFSNEMDESTFIVGRIEELLQKGHKEIEGDLSYDDFAIIARNKYVFGEIEKQLIKKEIPFFYKKTVSGIDSESDFMKVFELSMRLLINQRDVIHLRELIMLTKTQDLEGATFNSGFELLQSVLNDSSYSKILDALKEIENDNFEFAKSLQVLNDFASNTTSFNDDDRYLICSDIKHWENHWKKYIGQVQREHRTLVSFRNLISLGKTQDISADSGIALLTAHMSKGLQYEVVFVAGLTEGTFPDYRAVNSGEKEMEQEKNNMYVAATRAKRLCYLTYPKVKMMPWGELKSQRKSRFIIDIKEEIMVP